MRGLWLEEGRLTLRADLPRPEPLPGEALVRVVLAGICGTDLQMVDGYHPFRGVPGHEFVGRVVQAGRPGWEGRRVVGEINVGCGKCGDCNVGNRSHCRHRTAIGIRDRDGVFAEFVALPLCNIWPVPDSVSDERAVFVEPLAAALRIQEQLPVSPSRRVLVVGAGRLGQLVSQTMALSGCHLRIVVRHSWQREALGPLAACVVDEGEVEDGAADLVVEASGSPGGFRLARRAVAAGGVIVLKSTYSGLAEVDLSSLAVDEVTLVGSRCGPFEPALRLLERDLVRVTPLIVGVFELEEGVEAFQRAKSGGKVLLRP